PPPPPPPPPAAPPGDDGQKDGNNGGGGVGGGGATGGDAAGGAGDGSGDGKGNGKGLPNPPTTFQDIKLDDVKLNAPPVRPPPQPESKSTFGSWVPKLSSAWSEWTGGGGGGGGGHDTSTAAAATKIEDNPWDKPKGKPEAVGSGKQNNDDLWGFGTTKEQKKNTLFGAGPEETKDNGDPWGWGDSKKKGKPGGILEELALDSEPAPPAGKKDIWDTWGISKKDREKKKGIAEEAGLSPVPDPPPIDDSWDGWSGQKDKTKKSSLWGAQEPIPVPVPDPPSVEDKNGGDDFWSTFGTDKARPEEERPGWSSWGLTKKEPEPEPGDDGWDMWGTGKKKKKAGDLIQLGDEIPPPAPDPIAAVGADDFLDSWGFGKKPKKSTVDPFAFKTPGTEDPGDDFWGSIENKTPNTHNFLIGEIIHDDMEEGVESKVMNTEDDNWDWTSISKTKKSKHRIDALTDLPPPSPTPPFVELTETEELIGDPEQAAREAEEQAAREVEDAEAARDDEEMAALLEKKAKRGGKLLKTDRERLALLEGNATRRAEARTAREAAA
ncbi:hypothetical protein F66182_11607, partial [Fusarium sp. NRRL 66182]